MPGDWIAVNDLIVGACGVLIFIGTLLTIKEADPFRKLISLGIMIGGVLPAEEVLFFLLTNMLIVFGLVLFIATDNTAVKQFARRALRHTSQ